MKKIASATIIALTITNVLFAQGFLDKVKNKVTKAIEQKEPVKPANSSTGDVSYTDPSKFGTVLMTFSAKEMSDHMGGSDGGYNLWFSSVKVINNQLELKINDYNHSLGSYSNGQFQKTNGDVDVNNQNSIANGSELELKSKDFSQTDMMNAMLKKGPSVAGARVPGKIGMQYTFKGKPLGEYMTASLAHNPDSSAIAVVGQGFAAGALKYTLALSSGPKVDLPIKITGWPIISVDGKIGGAIVQSLTGSGADVYLSNGNKVSIGSYDANFGVWMHNSGTIYYVNNGKELFKNGQTFLTANLPILPKTLFVSSNDNSACWAGNRGLWFSDGTKFENGECPHKVTINNKEIIVFLDIDIPTGKLYLCQHEL